MADYAKKKNDELAALCKERNLPHTGKKADLVKRLEEHDTKSGGGDASASKPPANEDEIDWDDEPATEQAKAATTEASANVIAAGGKGQVANPQAVPNQEAAIDPAQTDDLSVAPPAADAPATAEEKNDDSKYSSGLADRTLDEEIEVRKARARKFGMPEDSEEIKALERAKKFGTTSLPGLLNKALPERSERKRGREGAEKDDGDRKKSKGRDGRGRDGRGRGGRQGGGDRPPKKENSSAGGGGYPGWMTENDREAAERRKAKFAN